MCAPDASQTVNSTGKGGAGDPIDVASGNVSYTFTDYRTAGQNPLAFTRYYNSGASTTGYAKSLGSNWRSNYDRYIDILTTTVINVERPSGQVLRFFLNGSTWSTDTDPT
jgi:hypothetical protein